MSSVSSLGPVSPQSPDSTRATDLRDVDLDQFLQLLITELQNQDPLNPMDNSQILQQIGQIREIGATNQLTETLGSVLAGQNLATASSLIGQQVRALNDASEDVQGVVDRVSVEAQDDEGQGTRTLRLHVGEHRIRLTNIREIVSN